MDVITIESQAFKEIARKLDKIEKDLLKKSPSSPDETWLDVCETCSRLKISKRLLQQYRDKNVLPYSQFSGKIYFKASDIQLFLESHYNGKK
jgi:hypothetical protein